MIGYVDRFLLGEYIRNRMPGLLEAPQRINNGGGCGQFVQAVIEEGTRRRMSNPNNIFFSGTAGNDIFSGLPNINFANFPDTTGQILCICSQWPQQPLRMIHYCLSVCPPIVAVALNERAVIGMNGFFNLTSHRWGGGLVTPITGNLFNLNGSFNYDNGIGLPTIIKLIDYDLEF